MFPNVTAPTLIQTVHGLTYRVNPVSSKEEDEDPQSSKHTPAEDGAMRQAVDEPKRARVSLDQTG